jgi:cation diffusion facilitator family transporter
MINNEKEAIKVSVISIVSNIFLTIIKFIAGLISHSQAMISDSIHSLSDVLSTFVVIIGVKLSNKKADKEHPYGHERLECVASIILSVMLIFTGIAIGITGIKNIISRKYVILISGTLALIIAILSILVKEAMYWYTKIVAKKINSGALLADAWHHRSDALSSIGSFIGILGTKLGFPVLDSIASIIICLFIIKVAIDIFKDAIDKMVDRACDEETINKIETIINKNKKVISIDDLKTRQFGNRYYIDVEISVDKNMSILSAHSIAQNLHDTIEEKIPFVKHCMVHVNPNEEETEK